MIITTGRKHFAAAIVVAVASAFILAVPSQAGKPEKPTPTPAPTATPKPTATPVPKASCPLADDYGVKKTVSPEKPLQAVCHNGKILCLPQSAANAHIQHGDQPLGPCSKQGNQGPCP